MWSTWKTALALESVRSIRVKRCLDVRPLQQFAFCFTFNYQLKLHGQADRQTNRQRRNSCLACSCQGTAGGEPLQNRIAIAELAPVQRQPQSSTCYRPTDRPSADHRLLHISLQCHCIQILL